MECTHLSVHHVNWKDGQKLWNSGCSTVHATVHTFPLHMPVGHTRQKVALPYPENRLDWFVWKRTKSRFGVTDWWHAGKILVSLVSEHRLRQLSAQDKQGDNHTS